MAVRRASLATWLLPVALGAAPAAGYDVVLEGGPHVRADGVAWIDGSCRLLEGDRTRPCPGPVDHEATLRANQGGSGGNAVFFRTGGWTRFESLTFDGDRAVLGLGDGAAVAIPADLIDARRTVFEAGTVDLPPGVGSARPAVRPPSRSRVVPSRTRRPRGR